MAQVDGIAGVPSPPKFQLPAGSHGAIVRLRTPAGAGASCVMDHWQVSVAPESDVLLLVTDDGDHTWEQVAETAERALDVLSVMAGQSYEVAKLDARTERFKWRWDGSRFHIEVLLLWRLHAPLTLLTGHVADGPPSEEQPKPGYHQGMRYFRCSQIAGRPALAFQYLFLALESLLAAKRPKQRDQRELDWLKQALAAETPSYLTGAREAIEARGGLGADLDRIYGVRLALFHAKPERQPLVPLDLPSEPRIREAYWRLATHVLELLRGWNVSF